MQVSKLSQYVSEDFLYSVSILSFFFLCVFESNGIRASDSFPPQMVYFWAKNSLRRDVFLLVLLSSHWNLTKSFSCFLVSLRKCD